GVIGVRLWTGRDPDPAVMRAALVEVFREPRTSEPDEPNRGNGTMSDTTLVNALRSQLDELRQKGLYKRERHIQTPQGTQIRVNGKDVINFCANNYLGLANPPPIVAAAEEGLKRYGYGLSSVRFICGTQELHKQLEERISRFFGKQDAILYT